MKTKTRLKRLAAAIGALLVILILALGVTLGVWLRRPFPQTEGTIRAAGLAAPVDIYRDALGVPHVYAQSRADMLFAQGYLHAQDRFWQMELTRRAAQGRLAEVIGPAALETDQTSRRIGYNRVARSLLDYYQQSYPELVRDLEAYSSGVSAYLAEHSTSTSFNHTFVSLQNNWPIEPWTTYDTVSFGTYMAWSFEGSWNNDYSNSVVAAAVDPAKQALLLPGYPESRPAIVTTPQQTGQPPVDRLDPRIAEIVSRAQPAAGADLDRLRRLHPTPPGSNSWVISGNYTASGKPILANDPHLQATLPTNFYQMGLHSPDMDVVGFSLPGGPGIVIGRNQHISWGLTNAVIDVQEAYVERLNPENPLQYEVNGEWRDLETIQEVIKVAGAPDSVLDVQLTRHGPIMQEVPGDKTRVVTVQWQGHKKPFRLFKAILDLNAATNYEQFRQALSFWESPALNVVYGDDQGNIAYQLVANVPIRSQHATRYAVPGWIDENEWTGWVDFADLPAALNPEQGYIVTANNLITRQHHPGQFVTDPGDRAQRIGDLLQAQITSGEQTTLDTVRLMQMDYYSQLAETYVPLITQLDPPDPELQPIVERLRSWNYQLAPDSPEAGFFSIFLMQLSQQLFGDELKDLYAAHASDHTLAVLLSMRLLANDPTHAWWDNAATPETETRDQIVTGALKATTAWLKQHAGSTIDDWQWGNIHTITFRSLPLGISGIMPLERLVNRGPYPVGGDVTTINDHSWLFNGAADTFFYPALRFVADMSDPNTTLGLGSIGQSGHPTHTNYDDMIPLWLAGQTPLMPLNPANKDQQQHLILAPAEPQ
ncbi:MAG TPA: penicillin acylase family protein [Herpetosiphonaceae bacterium]